MNACCLAGNCGSGNCNCSTIKKCPNLGACGYLKREFDAGRLTQNHISAHIQAICSTEKYQGCFERYGSSGVSA